MLSGHGLSSLPNQVANSASHELGFRAMLSLHTLSWSCCPVGAAAVLMMLVCIDRAKRLRGSRRFIEVGEFSHDCLF